MLVLSRERDEEIIIDGHIVVKVVRIGPNSVRIGIDAPSSMSIHRKEICDVIQQQRKEPPKCSPL